MQCTALHLLSLWEREPARRRREVNPSVPVGVGASAAGCERETCAEMSVYADELTLSPVAAMRSPVRS